MSRSDPAQSVARAWEDFTRRIGALGQTLFDPDMPGRDPAHGFRMLSGITTAGLQWSLNFADPDYTSFHCLIDDVIRFAAPNADNYYLYARVRGDRDYRVFGNSNGNDFTVDLLVGTDMSTLGANVTSVGISSTDCQIASDGSFEIVVSPTRHEGNWLQSHPQAQILLMREYFHDWDRDVPGVYQIERLGLSGSPPALTPERMIVALDEAAAWIERATRTWGPWAPLHPRFAPVNVIPAPQPLQYSQYIRYGIGFYEMGSDEALIIEFEPPRARYHSFNLYNMWGEQLDWANRTTSLNAAQLRVDSDGLCRIVVAHADPGTPNWLDTEGHLAGVVLYRAVWLESAEPTRCRVVKFDEVAKALPEDTPRVSRAERDATLAKRRLQIGRRYRT